MVLAKPNKAFLIAGIATLFSALGGLLGYLIGYFLWVEIGEIILNVFHLENDFEKIREHYNEVGSLAVLAASITPFPYKVITLFSGFIAMNLFTFLIISLFGRGLRFFILAGLIFYFGERSYIAFDEGFYALQARWILDTGNWTIPMWWDEYVLDRTIGLQFLIAKSQEIFG